MDSTEVDQVGSLLSTMGHHYGTSPLSFLDQQGSNLVGAHLMHHLSRTRDVAALTLGMISVISWGIAEVPQIIINYKDKSTEGLSVAFLMTWIVGDIFNLAGCLLEPATLPTQFYMALLYTATTSVLTAQTIYYVHLYQRVKASKVGQPEKIDELGHEDALPKEKLLRKSSDGRGSKFFEYQVNGSSPIKAGHNMSNSPIPDTSPVGSYGSMGRDLYYMSARSLSASPVPTAGSWLAHSRDSCRTPPSRIRPILTEEEDNSSEPLLGRQSSQISAPPLNMKNTLCVVSSAALFIGICGIQLSLNCAFDTKHQELVIPIGRKLLQHYALEMSLSEGGGSSGIGSILGWAMAAIYMGGRLPQIWLNIRRGNVEGLSPFMFLFALVGNSTYVGSILVNSLELSAIRPNLPWLVDAGGCILLDAFILIQFIYFNYGKPDHVESLHDC